MFEKIIDLQEHKYVFSGKDYAVHEEKSRNVYAFLRELFGCEASIPVVGVDVSDLFQSIYFETLLVLMLCTNYTRMDMVPPIVLVGFILITTGLTYKSLDNHYNNGSYKHITKKVFVSPVNKDFEGTLVHESVHFLSAQGVIHCSASRYLSRALELYYRRRYHPEETSTFGIFYSKKAYELGRAYHVQDAAVDKKEKINACIEKINAMNGSRDKNLFSLRDDYALGMFVFGIIDAMIADNTDTQGIILFIRKLASGGILEKLQ